MVSNILRWSANGLLVLLLSVVLVITSFRLAASVRETGARAQLAPRTGQLVPTRSGGVFVQEKGPADGIPVVLFHGTAAWSELWRHTSDALASAGFHVIAVDLPPFGFSDRPGSYTRQDQASRVSDVLDALKAEPAIIVGHSFGAGAATELAMRYPDRARALVLVDAALGLTAPPSAAPWVIQPQWIREILVSLTITNPMATQMLLKSLIAKKERALPDIVAGAIAWSRSATVFAISPTGCIISSAPTQAPRARTAMPMAKVEDTAAILWGNKDSYHPG